MITSIFQKARWALTLASLSYVVLLLTVQIPWLQPQLLYLHNYNPSWWKDINNTNQFGFAKNQVVPFNITTPDHENIYAWHVLPLGLYAKHESELRQEPSGFVNDVTETKAFDLLRNNPQSRLIVYFHGNAANVAQGWRVDSFRALAGSDINTHILAIDYRGFGLSSGTPSEPGVIIDSIAALDWAMKVAQIPAERIVVFGHSFGTAVACAAVEHFTKKGIEFAGLILVSGFTTIPDLLPYYSSGGIVRLLSPLDTYPSLRKWFNSHIIETWPTITRLANLVRLSRKLKLTIIHSIDDDQIPWTQSELLFTAACNATLDRVTDSSDSGVMKARSSIDLGDKGISVNECRGVGGILIREEIVSHGQHNRILTSAHIILAVRRVFSFD